MSRIVRLAERLLYAPEYLKVNERRAVEVAESLKDYPLSIPTWDYEGFYPQSVPFEEACLFFLIFNSINYCYFDASGNKFRHADLCGSGLAARRLLESWDEIKDPNFLSNIDENYLLSDLLHADSPVSMCKARTEALREVGRFLVSNTDFTFAKLFRKYRSNAYFVSQGLPTHLPTWRDPFFKRSQLFVAMVYGRFQSSSTSIITEGLSDLAVFADYKLPQTLIAMGIIELFPSLQSKISNRIFLDSGSKAELEIRAATVVGAKYLLDSLCRYKKDNFLNALHVDSLLWNTARGIRTGEIPDGVFTGPWLPHHLTVTTDY